MVQKVLKQWVSWSVFNSKNSVPNVKDIPNNKYEFVKIKFYISLKWKKIIIFQKYTENVLLLVYFL